MRGLHMRPSAPTTDVNSVRGPIYCCNHDVGIIVSPGLIHYRLEWSCRLNGSPKCVVRFGSKLCRTLWTLNLDRRGCGGTPCFHLASELVALVDATLSHFQIVASFWRLANHVKCHIMGPTLAIERLLLADSGLF